MGKLEKRLVINCTTNQIYEEEYENNYVFTVTSKKNNEFAKLITLLKSKNILTEEEVNDL